MKYFNVEKDTASENNYMVVLKIIIQKEKFQSYPEFLKGFENEKNKREGYPTKFWYIVPKKDKSFAYEMKKNIAIELANEYEKEYSNIIENCENSGDWKMFPFNIENIILIYQK